MSKEIDYKISYDLRSEGANYPINLIGRGILEGERLLGQAAGQRKIIYATFHQSEAYGCPAFWFANEAQLMDIIRPTSAGRYPSEMDNEKIDLCRAVVINGRRLTVDLTGMLARYAAQKDDTGLYHIKPLGFEDLLL